MPKLPKILKINTKIYKVLKKLGEGGNGIVYLCSYNDQQYSIKVSTHAANQDYGYFVKRDRAMMDMINKINEKCYIKLPRIVDIVLDERTKIKADKIVIYVVLDYIQGYSLKELIGCIYKSNYIIPDNDILKIAINLIKIVSCLHDVNIIHYDIKPANIIIDSKTNNLVLIDYDVMCSLKGNNEVTSCKVVLPGFFPFANNRKYHYATRNYTSPELASIRRKVDFTSDKLISSDIWAIGITIYQLTVGSNLEYPCDMDNHQADFSSFSLRAIEDRSPKLVKLLKKLLDIDYTKRLNLKHIIDKDE